MRLWLRYRCAIYFALLFLRLNLKTQLRSVYMLSLLYTLCTFFFPVSLYAGAPEQSPTDEARPRPNARPQIIKILDSGISQKELIMNSTDSVVFFYNDTKDELVALEIDFGSNEVHCSSAVVIVKKPGLARTRKPFGPKEFASTCFHDAGVYPFKVFGSSSKSKVYSGVVKVR
jgi:hypothetical protein